MSINFWYCSFIPWGNIRQTGFIAQEVLEAAQKTGYDFNGVHTPESATDNYCIGCEKMVVPLV